MIKPSILLLLIISISSIYAADPDADCLAQTSNNGKCAAGSATLAAC